MSSVVSALTGGGGSGANFQAQRADVINPVTQKQADEQYANVQNGLTGQQNFLQAVNAQNGLGNQTAVFNQMQGVANGTGPNPAQAQLANATGANVANQAALMAGQRGSNANAGLMARQAAQAGAGIQQNAAGQAAALQAQQSLGAMNQMGNIATNQANQQANATNAYSNAAQGAQGQVLGAIQGVNNANVGATSSQNSANAGVAGQVAGGQMNLIGNIAGGIGAGLLLAEGGAVTTPLSEPAPAGPKSKIGQYFANSNMVASPQANPLATGGNQLGQGIGSAIKSGVGKLMAPSAMPMAGGMNSQQMMAAPTMMAAEGGKVPAMVSPGERYLTPSAVKQVAKGANPMEVGEKIPGKPKVGGANNSYSNDTVPKTLEEGGIVLPRSVTESKHPHWAAHKFVAAIMKEKALKGGKK